MIALLVRGRGYLRYAFYNMRYRLGFGKRQYRAKSLSKIFERYKQVSATSLDIGSGPYPKNPFSATYIYGVDIRSNEERNVVYGDLLHAPLPFGDETFDYVTAHDLLEHIPRVISRDGCSQYPFINLLNEIFRVLKPGGIFFSIQPVFPSKEAFQDPTHVNIMSEDTMALYFCESAWARIYGYVGSFDMLNEGWLGGKYFAFMRKSTDQATHDLAFVQK